MFTTLHFIDLVTSPCIGQMCMQKQIQAAECCSTGDDLSACNKDTLSTSSQV